jgi:GT2 family glycosyltransferase
MGHSATILITTKNRRDELRRALRSVLSQDISCSILVFDDGSTDGTSEAVGREFPFVRVVRSERSLGIIAARNAAMRLCDTSVVVTIDDDCVVQSPGTIRQTLSNFDHPRVAAVAIPCCTPTRGSQEPLPLSCEGRRAVSEFTGCSNAVRLDVFLQLGGFREDFWRQVEEYDFCTRLLEAGYVVLQGDADPIFHYESHARNADSIVFYNVRNHIIYAWANVPGWRMPLHAAISTLNTTRAALRRGFVRPAVAGALAGLAQLLRHSHRSPVSLRTYLLVRRLRKERGLPFGAVLSELSKRAL